MLRQMLKSKIHRATVTNVELNYEGSIACDPEWLQAVDILPGEKVLVANLNNGVRFETYAITGQKNQISLRGADWRPVDHHGVRLDGGRGSAEPETGDHLHG